MTVGPRINEDAEGLVPFERTQDRSTLEELFSAASGDIADDGRPRLTRAQRRRRLIRIGIVLAVIVAAAGGGWAWSVHAAKQPALKALKAGNAAFEPAVEELRLASDLDEVKEAAADASTVADRVERARRSIAEPTSDLERRVLSVLAGEAALLRAAGEMATLDVSTLGQWPTVRTKVADAEKALESDVRRLGNVDADAARSVRTGHALAPRTDEVVGDFAETTALERLGEHLDGLSAASTTQQVRVAARTTRSGDVVTRLLTGVDETSAQGAQVVTVGETLEVIGKLTKLDGDHLSLWKPTRAALLTASEDLEGADTEPAVEALDTLVAGAQKKLSAWEKATERAEARNERDVERVEDYRAAVGPVLEAFEAESKQASDFFRRVQRGEKGRVTYPTASKWLDGAQKDLTRITTGLADAKPLPPLRTQHRALRDVLDRAELAVRNGKDGIARPLGCYKRPIPRPRPANPNAAPLPDPVCYYGSSPGWSKYSSGWGEAVRGFTEARTNLDDATEALLETIEGRKLPKKPVV